jgi:FixJ family two-component response regulator
MSHTTHSYVAVVDDDESLGRSLGRLLRAAGYQPVIYPSAEAFLADAKQPEFDCIVLDVQMGGMSGMELSRRLASSGSTTPVVFITAHDDPDERAQALRIPGAAYLRKSEPAETVLAAIRRAIQSNASTPTARS